jgi:RNA polymerase sigma factor (sigma-70 family)
MRFAYIIYRAIIRHEIRGSKRELFGVCCAYNMVKALSWGFRRERTWMEESELIRLVQRGDQEAFRGLVEMYAGPAGRTARVLLHDPADAEDAVQEAWVDAWRAMPRFRAGEPFRPWILTLMANRCRMKARRRRPQTTPYSDEFAEMGSDSHAWASHAPDYDVELHEALGELDGEQREALALRYYADLSLAEIAEVTGTPLGTVKSRLHRAITRLRVRLAPFYSTTPTGE